MTLSTSSSSRHALLIILIALCVLGTSVLAVNAFTRMVEKNAGDVFGIQRIRSVVDSMDYIARQPGKTVLVFGSSLVNEGFSPRYFDRQAEALVNADVNSFNLGMGNMKPGYQLLLARRLREAHQRSGQQAEVSVIELTPFLLTRKRNAFRPFMTEQVTAVAMSDEELLDLVLDDPERFARLACIRYLRDGISAEAITGGLRYVLGAAQAQAPMLEKLSADQLDHLKELRRLQGELRQHIVRDQPLTHKSIVWNPATQGGLIDMMDLSADGQDAVRRLTQKMQHPSTLQRDAEGRVDCCDIVDLEFDPDMVEEFIAIVEEFKQFSRHVEVVLLPSNHSLIAPSADALARQQKVLDTIAERTGVPQTDFQTHPAFTPDMFYDATHLSMDKGKILFSEMLATSLRDTLAGSDRRMAGGGAR